MTTVLWEVGMIAAHGGWKDGLLLIKQLQLAES